jgi:ATP-dependent Clp protease ATP-binding subunit ClpA
MHNEELSGRHFTTSAIHVVEQLWPRAADRGMISEVNEHTLPTLALWSILRWERKVGLVSLERMGVDVGALADDVGRTLDAAAAEIRQRAGPQRLQTLPSGQCGIVVDFQTPLAPLLAAAEHEALELGHSWVGTEHLLLAVIRLADPGLCEVLTQHRIMYDGARQAVVKCLQP